MKTSLISAVKGAICNSRTGGQPGDLIPLIRRVHPDRGANLAPQFSRQLGGGLSATRALLSVSALFVAPTSIAAPKRVVATPNPAAFGGGQIDETENLHGTACHPAHCRRRQHWGTCRTGNRRK